MQAGHPKIYEFNEYFSVTPDDELTSEHLSEIVTDSIDGKCAISMAFLFVTTAKNLRCNSRYHRSARDGSCVSATICRRACTVRVSVIGTFFTDATSAVKLTKSVY